MTRNFRWARLIWEQKRWVSKIPLAYPLYKLLTRWMYRDGAVVTIRRGPLAGWKWRHRRDYQVWMAMGAYEPHVAQLLLDHLPPGAVFYDIGANAGYFTLVGAKAVGPTGKVIAFDPVPRNAATVKDQIDLNQLGSSCAVEPLAIAGENGRCQFVIARSNANSHLADTATPHAADAQGEVIDVTTVTLDHYTADHPWPHVVKMDIEGAEVAALGGALKMLHAEHAPKMFVSTHSDELDRRVKEILAEAGYEFMNLPGFEQMVCAVPRRGVAAGSSS